MQSPITVINDYLFSDGRLFQLNIIDTNTSLWYINLYGISHSLKHISTKQNILSFVFSDNLETVILLDLSNKKLVYQDSGLEEHWIIN